MKTPWWFTRKTPLAFMLVPVSWIYSCASRLVRMTRGWRSYAPRRAVICIGNIFAGGVGKTPVVRAVARHLNAPVVMRGYKKSPKTGNVGDEASMLARAGLQVHTGDRKSNIMLLDRQAANTPIVMDDGFQNPTITKTLSVLVFDESLGYGNGFILPAGPLRESKRAVQRADAIVVIRSGARANLRFTLPVNIPIFYATNTTVNPYDASTPVVAFAGIGYPKKFFGALPGNIVATRSFADHYQYTDADIEKLIRLAARKNAKLVTTEKDWVRLPEKYRERIQFARLDTEIDPAFFAWIKENLKCRH